MDTVEWGSVEPARQRLPRRFSTRRIGGLVLVAVGFALLVAAEMNPWAVGGSAGANGVSAAHVSVGLEVETAAGIGYHLGAVALFGVVGLVLGAPAGRRLGLLGAAAGVGAGQLLMVVEVLRVLSRGLQGAVPGQTSGADTVVTGVQVSYGVGLYCAVGGILASVAAAVLTSIRWRELVAGVPVGAAQPAGEDAGPELTVTALEPLDEGSFARE